MPKKRKKMVSKRPEIPVGKRVAALERKRLKRLDQERKKELKNISKELKFKEKRAKILERARGREGKRILKRILKTKIKIRIPKIPTITRQQLAKKLTSRRDITLQRILDRPGSSPSAKARALRLLGGER